MGNFCGELQHNLGTSLKMSTSQHPQTDGQSERDIRTVKDTPRAYVNTEGTNWQDFPFAAEFGHNNSDSPTPDRLPSSPALVIIPSHVFLPCIVIVGGALTTLLIQHVLQPPRPAQQPFCLVTRSA